MREKEANGEVTCGKGRWEEVSHLNQVEQIPWREGKKEGKRKRKRKKRGVRDSTFSLEFTEIGLLVSIRARGKVNPHDESFV